MLRSSGKRSGKSMESVLKKKRKAKVEGFVQKQCAHFTDVFKIAGLVHQSLVGAAPAYLADDCRLLSDVGRRALRSNSNDTRKLLVPRTHNKFGDFRSFSAAGPRLWNDIPPRLRRPGLTFDSFRQSLKTHLFGDRSA